MTLYRYGWMAWVWRPLIAAALAGGAWAVWGATRLGDPWLAVISLPLVAPALALGWMVATRVERRDEDLHVRTLLGVPRTIPVAALGRPHLRLTAAAHFMQIDAPRVWVPVHRRLPVYLDLWADIPDVDALDAVVPLSPALRHAIQDG